MLTCVQIYPQVLFGYCECASPMLIGDGLRLLYFQFELDMTHAHLRRVIWVAVFLL